LSEEWWFRNYGQIGGLASMVIRNQYFCAKNYRKRGLGSFNQLLGGDLYKLKMIFNTKINESVKSVVFPLYVKKFSSSGPSGLRDC
jgi:hypothetical protein